MRRFLSGRVTTKGFDETASLAAGVLLLAACTSLVLLMLWELHPRTTFFLGAAIGAAWLVLAQTAWRAFRR
jgi:hypothetical protein